MNTAEARNLFGKNFIGKNELTSISEKLNASNTIIEPDIQFSDDILRASASSHILILGISENAVGVPLTINSMRDFFGIDPSQKEPCFYNQDWYVKEDFASQTVLENKWYLIKKDVAESSRAVSPVDLMAKMERAQKFPSAILCAFTFFANYFINSGEILWKSDFVWCQDTDHNGDRIYVGRYVDPAGVNKNGFNVHRHLSLRPVYGAVYEVIE